jgi:hypothetical protein
VLQHVTPYSPRLPPRVGGPRTRPTSGSGRQARSAIRPSDRTCDMQRSTLTALGRTLPGSQSTGTRTMWKSLLTGLLLACAIPVFAADDAPEDYSDLVAKDPATSIQRLDAICSSADKGEQLFCYGYITAMVESMIAVGKEPLAREYGICPTTPISAAASVQAFKNWVQRHPKHVGLIRYSGVAWALQERWPCGG